mmetsp:Transcript_17828/g.30238  ORF Transcript_17828/g.30238 Transcript_17828/m.30238 type:complete len:288 (+) Transcript_17828:288-1151(+)
MWNTHKNRVDLGLGGTYKKSGHHDSIILQDKAVILPEKTVSLRQIYEGVHVKPQIMNPFVRWHETFGDYPDHLGDLDFHEITKTDDYERVKKLKPSDDKVVGNTDLITPRDTDTEPMFFNVNGESAFTPPPDPNAPTVDHGVDEEYIWSFQQDLYNQNIIHNPYLSEMNKLTKTHAPWWGHKLMGISFYKREKMDKFFRHWDHRIGLDLLLRIQARRYGPNPTDLEFRSMEAEISKYIKECEDFEHKMRYDNVFVTDHVADEPKYILDLENDEEDYYEYMKSLEEYQ